MGRVPRILAALLVVAASAGCGADASEGAPPWSSPAAEPTPSVDTPAPAPSSAVEKTTFEQAMARYVAGHYPRGSRYVGDCANAKPDPRGVCGLRKAIVDAGEVWTIGAPNSEVDGFLLLSRGDAGWRVADSYAAAIAGDGVDPGPAPSWFAGIG